MKQFSKKIMLMLALLALSGKASALSYNEPISLSLKENGHILWPHASAINYEKLKESKFKNSEAKAPENSLAKDTPANERMYGVLVSKPHDRTSNGNQMLVIKSVEKPHSTEEIKSGDVVQIRGFKVGPGITEWQGFHNIIMIASDLSRWGYHPDSHYADKGISERYMNEWHDTFFVDINSEYNEGNASHFIITAENKQAGDTIESGDVIRIRSVKHDEELWWHHNGRYGGNHGEVIIGKDVYTDFHLKETGKDGDPLHRVKTYGNFIINKINREDLADSGELANITFDAITGLLALEIAHNTATEKAQTKKKRKKRRKKRKRKKRKKRKKRRKKKKRKLKKRRKKKRKKKKFKKKRRKRKKKKLRKKKREKRKKRRKAKRKKRRKKKRKKRKKRKQKQQIEAQEIEKLEPVEVEEVEVIE